MAKTPEEIHFTDNSKLVEDISSLYLNEEFSDVTFTFDGQKLYAHKVEVPIIEFSVEAFRMFFKYIYSGGVTLDPSNMNVVTEVLILARQHSFSKFESSIMKKMEALLNLQNVPSVLNIANRFEFNELMEMCYTFLEEHASEFLGNDSFNKLSQTSLVRLLKRHTFYAPEIEIFKSVVKWMIGENWATIAYKAEAVSGTNTDFLVNGTKDVKKFASHVIGDEEGIIIKLEIPAFVNHISMKFPDTDQRYYSYYIEVSTDKKNWKKIIDYSKYSCRSLQDLYFEQEIVRYIKIKGTNSTVDNRLHLLFFQVDYKSTIPRMTNGIICPTANVATPEKNAIVIQ
ncbi:BTB, BACK, and/or F5 F8 type C domain containing protein, partial [Asbolus verrucosus]